MARRKTLPDSVRTKCSLSERLTQLRAELFGDRGGPELARRLGIPVRTWYNYEAGVTVPAEVVLKIIELSSVEPMWLLHGRGPKFRPRARDDGRGGHGPRSSAGALLRSALQILEDEELSRRAAGHGPATESASTPSSPDVVLIEVSNSRHEPLTSNSGPRYVAARTEWLDAERDCRCIRNSGEAMIPIVGDGAYVAFSKSDEAFEELEGKLVVAWVEGQPIVRWLQHCGRFVLLRAQNPDTNPAQILIDLQDASQEARFRRVLWINTPH